ncbi:N-acetyltransferase [Streptomyces sp. BI20]|uniref:N-acetyltransferase n=1 Tax=Streptomyces sp. BI20 TaxID=3403460 RepID=UPI003C779EAA
MNEPTPRPTPVDLVVTTLAERPELASRLWEMTDNWPAFSEHDSLAWLLYPRMVAELPEYVLVATDGPEGPVVARGFSVPFALRRPDRGGEAGELPARGWDQALLWAFSDLRTGAPTDTVSAIEITVATEHLGRGLSGVMLAAMRENAVRRGARELVAPVRPNGKPAEPETPIEEYAARLRPDGLPHDAWLRVHVRAGGVVDRIAPLSMTISATLAEWREWTGLPFDEPGPVRVPGALVPVHCAPERDHAVYVEPNVWVRHALTD